MTRPRRVWSGIADWWGCNEAAKRRTEDGTVGKKISADRRTIGWAGGRVLFTTIGHIKRRELSCEGRQKQNCEGKQARSDIPEFVLG